MESPQEGGNHRGGNQCHFHVKVETTGGNHCSYCNGHHIFPFVKDRSLYPTHDPPLYSEQQHCML